jgi:hypothetical protein
VLYRARELDITFVINTDAHHVREYERMEWGVLQATRGWVRPERTDNTWPRKTFLNGSRHTRTDVPASRVCRFGTRLLCEIFIKKANFGIHEIENVILVLGRRELNLSSGS